MCIHYVVLHHDIINAGAGIFGGRSSSSGIGRHPIPNNGLIVSASDGLLLACISNSSQSGVGMITGLDGNTLSIGDTGVWEVFNPFGRPGVLRTISTTSIPAADQGIYTCTIPDNNDNQLIINVGLYSSGFMGELQVKVLPSVCPIYIYIL